MGLNDYKHPGETLTMPAPGGGVVHREGYVIGSVFVIALDDKAAGELFVGRVVGVHDLTKEPTEVWADGAQIFWDDTGKKATNVGPADAYIGAAEGPAANPTASSLVRLHGNGQAAPVTAADLAEFLSPQRIATGAAENIPHGLGVVPAANSVQVFLMSGHDGAAGTGDLFPLVVEGAHDATDIIVTVDAGALYKVAAKA